MKKYVPELAGYSRKYIYEPWKAPIADQKSWGCRITGDGNEAEVPAAAASSTPKMKTYPKPIFDFPERREICIQSIKHAYKINLHGADPVVLNGTWTQLFDSSPGGAGRDLLEGVDEDEREAAQTGDESQGKEVMKKRGGGRGGGDRGESGRGGGERKRRKVG